MISIELKGIKEVTVKMREHNEKVRQALFWITEVIANIMVEWAKDPPYPENPKPPLSDKDAARIRAIKKRGRIKKISRSKTDAGIRYKWKDRTSNARQGIASKVYWKDANTLVLSLYHQVEYGVWLELAMERKYAVLEAAIREKKPELIKQWKKIVGDK